MTNILAYFFLEHVYVRHKRPKHKHKQTQARKETYYKCKVSPNLDKSSPSVHTPLRRGGTFYNQYIVCFKQTQNYLNRLRSFVK